MTDEMNSTTGHPDRARSLSSGSLGKGPVVVGGVLAAILIAFMVFATIGAANALTGIASARSASVAIDTKAPPTPVPGDDTPGTDDPVTPPDRDSDQTVAPVPEDEIYYIQEGDTLTALSARFGMSIDAIATYNAVRDVNVISEGAALRVPFIYVPPVEPAA